MPKKKAAAVKTPAAKPATPQEPYYRRTKLTPRQVYFNAEEIEKIKAAAELDHDRSITQFIRIGAVQYAESFLKKAKKA